MLKSKLSSKKNMYVLLNGYHKFSIIETPACRACTTLIRDISTSTSGSSLVVKSYDSTAGKLKGVSWQKIVAVGSPLIILANKKAAAIIMMISKHDQTQMTSEGKALFAHLSQEESRFCRLLVLQPIRARKMHSTSMSSE